MRPSLAATREAEILEAIEACIIEVGIGGLTTQRIAEKSGYSRSHIRHYLGNKNDQLQALVKVYSDRYASSLEDLIACTPRAEQRELVLRELFGDTWFVSRPDDDIVLDHLNAYASSNPKSEVTLAPMYDRIVEVIANTLSDVLGHDAALERARIVVTFAYGASSMIGLGVMAPEAAHAYGRLLLELPPAPQPG